MGVEGLRGLGFLRVFRVCLGLDSSPRSRRWLFTASSKSSFKGLIPWVKNQFSRDLYGGYGNN